MSIREQIQAANAKIEKVHVPEWGLDVWVRRLSVADLRQIRNHEGNGQSGKGDEVDVQRILVLACCDEQRKPIFTFDDCDWLAREAVGSAIGQLVEAIQRLNPSIFKGGAEELEKNSEQTQPSASSSGSPGT